MSKNYDTDHHFAYTVNGLGQRPVVEVWFSPAALAWVIFDEAVGRALIESMYRATVAGATARMAGAMTPAQERLLEIKPAKEQA